MIDANLSLPELLAQHPDKREVLERFNLLRYADSPASKYESLKAACLVVGAKLDEVLAALNQA